MSTPTPPGAERRFPRRLPAALLYFSSPDLPSRDWDPVAAELAHRHPDLRPAAPGLMACTPDRGHADVYDIALAIARDLLRSPASERLPATSELRVLLAPAQVEVDGDRARLLPGDALTQSLAARPELEMAPGVYITSRAAQALEGDWGLEDAGSWSARSMARVPILALSGWSADYGVPWRNASLLGKEALWIPRPELVEALTAGLASHRVRVVGPLGCGKSRLVAHALANRPGLTVWASPTHGPASLAEILLRRLLALSRHPSADKILGRLDEVAQTGQPTGPTATKLLLRLVGDLAEGLPLTLALDDLQRAGDADWELIDEILALPTGEQGPTVVLAGRSRSTWPAAASSGPTVEVPGLDLEQMSRLARYLGRGLEMPTEVLERFVVASDGSPFCLEEGLVELIHRKLLRRVYGSFFFGGGADIDYLPSARLTCHLLAEAHRLQGAFPVAALAAAGSPLPLAAFDTLAATLEQPTPGEWWPPFAEAGWVEPVETPWGDGVELTYQPAALALDASLLDEGRRTVRAALGHWLGEQQADAEAQWQAYRLMAGQEGAAQILLRTLRPLPPVNRREEVLAALRHELVELRKHGGTEDQEVELLWAMMPLARRMGKLRDIRPALDRAVVLCEAIPERLTAALALLADLEVDEGRPREAEAFLRRAIEVAVHQDQRKKHLLVVQLGRLLLRDQRYEDAQSLLERSLEELDDPKQAALAASCHFYLGNIALHQQRFEDAVSEHQQALLERERLGLHSVIGASLCALGATNLHRGDYQEALAIYTRALEQLEEYGREGESSFALVGLGRVHARLGGFTKATPFLRQAVELRSQRDGTLGEALARLLLAENLLDLEQLADALDEVRRAHFQLSMLEETPGLGDAERLLGRISLRQRHPDQARVHFQSAAALHGQYGHPTEATIDRGWLLATEVARRNRNDVEVLVRQLEEALSDAYPERGELVDFQAFEALEWLEAQGSKVPSPPLRFLRRAYRELLRRTSFLDQEHRSSYLMSVPEHQAIVGAATRHQLSLPGFL